MQVKIRPAEPTDVKAILALINELALFEKAPEQVINSEAQLLKDGFGQEALYSCFVAELNAEVIGISFCYVRYSTWKGACLYLEDLIVTEQHRRKGIGKQLLMHTIEFAKSKGYKRLQWQVLDWNAPAINFYKKYDALLEAGWLNAHLQDYEIKKLLQS